MSNGNPNVVPFGKYKGQPLDVLANDQGYLDWLNGQGWVKDKYPQFYTVIINNFQEPSETPEHNALQAMFLDNEFCVRFLCTLMDTYAEIHALQKIRKQRFEEKGVDVALSYVRWQPNSSRDGWREAGRVCAIEVKPSIGDDYPAILRQVQRMNRVSLFSNVESFSIDERCVVFRDFTAKGARFEQVRKMFNLSKILLFSLDEIQRMPAAIYPDEESLKRAQR